MNSSARLWILNIQLHTIKNINIFIMKKKIPKVQYASFLGLQIMLMSESKLRQNHQHILMHAKQTQSILTHKSSSISLSFFQTIYCKSLTNFVWIKQRYADFIQQIFTQHLFHSFAKM